jgi:hypothetical protein
MKKVVLFAAAGLIVLASCKKDYTCECKMEGTITGTVSGTVKDTKKKAKEECEKGTSSTDGQKVTCAIK